MTPGAHSPVARADESRIALADQVQPAHRSEFGQFFTPAPTAKLLASYLQHPNPDVRLLDAGAGVGALLAAVTSELCSRAIPPRSLHITAYEIDPKLHLVLHTTIAACREIAQASGVA